MKLPSKLIRNSFHVLIYIVVSLLVLAAIFLSVARLMLPAIEEYKPDIELWVSNAIGQQLEIATLDAAWYGLEPQLVLKGVQLLSKDRKETIGYFQQARIGFNIIGSLYEGRLKPGGLTIEGAHLMIVRQKNGNVSIRGLKNQSTAKPDSQNEALSDWLFNQRILDVKDSEIIWQDLKNNQAQWSFTQVNLQFKNDGDHHLINGAVTLPKELGARLEVAVDARGDFLSANGWSGTAYIEGANLRLAQWLKQAPMLKASVKGGMVGLRLWSQWRKAELSSLRGEVFSNGFQISVDNAPKMQVIESLSSNILIQKLNNAWEATFDEIIISTAKKVWPQARVDIKFDQAKDTIEAEVSYIDIGDVLPIVNLFDSSQSTKGNLVSHLKPSGIVSNISLSAKQISQSPKYFVNGKFSELTNLPSGKIPGAKKLEGQFSLNNDAFKIIIPPQNFILNYPGVFEYAAVLKNTGGIVYGKKDKFGFSLVAKDVHAEYREAITEGSLHFNVPANNGDPKLDLAFYFENGNVSDARYYIPSRIMHKNAVDWIGQSLLGGKVSSGGIVYFGNVKEFPFYKSEGLFDLTLNIQKGKLLFAKSWPEITGINGEFGLSANSLMFHADSAQTLGSQLSEVDVSFPEFRAAERKLLISGKVKGKSEDKIRYLHESPIETIFAKNIRPLKIKGRSQLDLSLDIPLDNIEKTQVSGLVEIRENHLLAEEWKLDIENISTDLHFDNKGIRAEKFTGVMDEVKLAGNIETRDEGGDYRNIIISNESEVNEKDITRLLGKFIEKAHWGRYLTGQTRLKTAIKIPIQIQNENTSANIKLELDADLEKIALSLPYPLEKQQGTPDTLKLIAGLSGEKRLLDIATNNLNALFEIVPAGNTQVITRGGIGFGKKAALPSENGYRFIGRLERFSWSKWDPIIFPAENETPLLAGGGAGGSQYFDVNVGQLEIFGSWFGQTSVQASSGAQLWSIHLSGEELAGEIFIPVVLSSAPLVMNMEKMVVERGEVNDEDQEDVYIDPRKMPEIKMSAKSFIYNNKNFGSLNVVAKKIESGLHLENFLMKTENTNISATGNWGEVDNKQISKFDILVNTSHLGKTISSWGFADAFGGGKGDIRIKASWAGKPSDFSFEVAAGSLDIDLKDVSLLDFELGAAKMVGLFLPRRLLLDFRDVFKKGMLFDSIKGQYQIEDGNAFTTNLNLDGPMADILMAGRIGLVAEDYDQLVTINRRLVGDSISTLAALAANPLVNPLLAAQVYALKKLFEKQIDDILSVQYTIKGTWESPKITPVVKNLQDRGAQIDELFE